MTNSFNTETELSSVNSILGSIGQAPVSRLYQKENVTYTAPYSQTVQECKGTINVTGTTSIETKELVYINPEIALIHQILQEVDADVQNEGWSWNTELALPLQRNADNKIAVPTNALQIDITDGQIYRDTDVIKRGGFLYDKVNHTYEFNNPTINCDVMWKIPFEDLPSVFKRYITIRASGRAATQMVTNPQLVQLLGTQEAQARAACMEYECNQGDYTFFGTPSNTSYRSYQPYITLAR